ncbi:hypothetical protein, partial [Acinetobacter baumannii]|uniref:hypothetical protein n=1 Tax=Acinetobacter baumannii TaxID=470 RepID=UPI001C07B4BC
IMEIRMGSPKYTCQENYRDCRLSNFRLVVDQMMTSRTKVTSQKEFLYWVDSIKVGHDENKHGVNQLFIDSKL